VICMCDEEEEGGVLVRVLVRELMDKPATHDGLSVWASGLVASPGAKLVVIVIFFYAKALYGGVGMGGPCQ
jgi:hypothetical protein